MSGPRDKLRTTLICSALALAALVVFWPTTHFSFINYDDPDYVYDNAAVQAGLSWPAIVWAVTKSHTGNWHPLTWLSHMVDWQLYGSQASGHHATNLLFHGLNTVLLFLLLRRLTGAIWRSALVAALFGLHPLHVQSVAWVAERKDVLSAFFFMLTLFTYAAYVSRAEGAEDAKKSETRNPRPPTAPEFSISRIISRPSFCYGLSLALFALGLMSKPMLVTLPLVLLLLDYWPLRRFRFPLERSKASTPGPAEAKPAPRIRRRTAPHPLSERIPHLLLEKLPFFALALGAGILTVWAQRSGGAMRTLAAVPLALRVSNALRAYAFYLEKTFWPADLAVFYPLPKFIPWWDAAVAVLVVGGISWLALRQIRVRPWLGVGWCWFLGTLVPVLGLVQVGTQAAADRYAYLPLIGVFIALVWGGFELLARWPGPRLLAVVVPSAILIACAGVSARQVLFWADSKTLFEHALKVTRDNYVAHFCLGAALEVEGKPAEAQAHYETALRLYPRLPQAENNLGNVLVSQNRLPEAELHYQRAIAFCTNYATVYEGMGLLYAREENWPEAARALTQAIAFGWRKAGTYWKLSQSLSKQGRTDEAVAAAENAVQRDPALAEAHFDLALLQAATGRTEATIEHLEEAARLRPNWTLPLGQLAWIRATHPEAQFRDGALAVEFAERAAAGCARREAPMLIILGAAYAEAGRYPEAIRVTEEAKVLAETAGNAKQAKGAAEKIQLYRNNRPFHQTPSSADRPSP